MSEKNPTANGAAEGTGNGGENGSGNGQGAGTGTNTGTGPSAAGTDPIIPVKKFKEPVVLEAVVDPNIKPKEGPVKFSFTTPKEIHAAQAQPTKGDIALQTETKKRPFGSIEEIDKAIARDEKQTNGEYTLDDYQDSAEMFVDAWEGAMIMFCRGWSKDTSETAYAFPTATREKLIRHGIKISRKRGWVMPIELMGGVTLLSATASRIGQASDKRKEYLKTLENSESNSGAKEEVIKGGPNKGLPKRRGPGNPRSK